MRDSHAGIKVTHGEFDAFIEDLAATLAEFKTPETEQQELLGLLLPLRDEIVEVKMSNPLEVPQRRASRELLAG